MAGLPGASRRESPVKGDRDGGFLANRFRNHRRRRRISCIRRCGAMATDEAMMRRAPTVVNALKPVVTWPQVPVPPGVDAWQEAESRRIVTDAVSIAESSVGDGEPTQIGYKFFVSAPVPTLVDLSRDAEMVVVGSRGAVR